MNAIDYMTRFEQDGLHLYELLEFEAENKEMKTTFGLLANRQRRHLEALHALERESAGKVTDSALVEKTNCLVNGFEQLLEARDIHAALKNDPDAFGHILRAEQECIKLMAGMAHAESDAGNKRLLYQLVEEEKAHLENIENIYEFITTPRTFLEWGEFSNLHQL